MEPLAILIVVAIGAIIFALAKTALIFGPLFWAFSKWVEYDRKTDEDRAIEIRGEIRFTDD